MSEDLPSSLKLSRKEEISFELWDALRFVLLSVFCKQKEKLIIFVHWFVHLPNESEYDELEYWFSIQRDCDVQTIQFYFDLFGFCDNSLLK